LHGAKAYGPKVSMWALTFLALSLLAEPAARAQVIKVCKKTSPAGGTGFPFLWVSGPTTPFTLDDAATP
jgi:hypothetical protein